MALKEQVTNVYGVGIRNVGSYQVSGIPWVTGSSSTWLANNKTIRYQFPYVTKSLTVINIGSNDVRLHFQSGSGVTIVSDGQPAAASSGNDVQEGYHFITVPSVQGAVTMDVKCTEIYLSNFSGGSSGYQVFAELTTIPTGRMFNLTGSGITE